MTTKMLENSITLERERESSNTKNIAIKVAAFVTPKIDIEKCGVSYV